MAFDGTYLYRVAELGNGRSKWSYFTADAITVVRAGGYIDSDDDAFPAINLGDEIEVRVVANPAIVSAPTAMQRMIVVAKTATALDLSDGDAVTLTNT